MWNRIIACRVSIFTHLKRLGNKRILKTNEENLETRVNDILMELERLANNGHVGQKKLKTMRLIALIDNKDFIS